MSELKHGTTLKSNLRGTSSESAKPDRFVPTDYRTDGAGTILHCGRGHRMVGAYFFKFFKASDGYKRRFKGTVTAYNKEDYTYSVKYNDGDVEDLSLTEMKVAHGEKRIKRERKAEEEEKPEKTLKKKKTATKKKKATKKTATKKKKSTKKTATKKKKATKKKPSKPTKPAAKDPSYKDMVGAAIVALKDRTGSSNIAIEKFILSNYPKVNFKRTFLRGAIKRGVESGFIAVHHNHKNSYKMGKVVKKTPTKKKSAAARPVDRPKKNNTKKKSAAKK